jgi:hypothetical protein
LSKRTEHSVIKLNSINNIATATANAEVEKLSKRGKKNFDIFGNFSATKSLFLLIHDFKNIISSKSCIINTIGSSQIIVL